MRFCKQALAHLLNIGIAQAQSGVGRSRMCSPCAAFQGRRRGCLVPQSGAESWRAWLQELPGSCSSGVTLTSAGQPSATQHLDRLAACTELARSLLHTEGRRDQYTSAHKELDDTTYR